jgi:hypothetical protein
MKLMRTYSEAEEAFWQKLTLPQDDLRRADRAYSGGYRWFRDPNVLPMEHWRHERNDGPEVGPNPLCPSSAA